MKKVLTAIMMAAVLSPALSAAPQLPAAEPLRHNIETTVDLGVGLWGIPLPVDYDGDGVNDLLVSCPDTPYKGIYYFRNIGTNSKPLFDRAEKLYHKAPNNIRVSYYGGKPHVLAKDTEYENFFGSFLDEPRTISYEGPVLGEGWNKSRSNMWNYADWDGDGDADIIVGIDTWDDYGWDNAYNSEGVWQNGPIHGYLYLLENVEGRYVNRCRMLAGGAEIDTFGAPCPCIADFDSDGDLDIICGEFRDRLTWFENRDGSLLAGKPLANKSGEIRFHVEMIVPVPFDFDKDGRVDLLVSDEDGSVCFVRNTGKVRKGMPQFADPVRLQQKADLVKFGALSTPCGFDWDGDGEEDIIAGNSAGEIAFIKNLGGGKAWDAPKLFTVGGKPFRIMAGENGSIQGPAECKWGYTVLSVADWDGDGKADIIINSIWGKIQWMKGLGGLKMSAPKPVTVAWEGEIPKPKWNWWKPEPGTLATQWRTTPVAIDWNKDGRMDLIVLDTEGYPAYFERLADGRLAPGKRIFRCKNGSVYDARSAGSTNNPRTGMKDKTPGILRLNELEAGQSGRRKICLTDWDKDGYLDLIVDGRFGAAWFRGGKEQNGLYPLEYKGAMSSTRLEGHTTCPTPVDWDKDGIYDILVGAEDGHFYILKNTMTNYSERIALYPEGTYPVEESIDEKGYIWGKIKPEILVYRPENPTGAAVLIVPGGGYEKNCITFEGYKTTELFLRYGITAFILKYRLPEGRPETTLEDGEAAIRLIRSRAEEFGINPHKLGIMGFSAGGHFCSSILTKFSSEETRPDFGILVYPVISYEYDNAGTHARLLGDNLEKDGPAWTATNNIRDDMPPVMLLACEDDRTVNPEFGTMQDFEELLAAAHEQGFRVILDWVANQTAPDNVWMTGKPADFYERDSLGNAIWEYDWTDTRSLNYENKEVWYAQEDAMRFWLDKGVDGFRCDAAGEMPSETWQYLVPALRRAYPDIYLLAEAEKPEFTADTMFDATYAWEMHHIENAIGNGPANKDGVKTAAELREYLAKDAVNTPASAFRLAFTSNHDENSWNGTEFERLGDAWKVMEVLNFTLPKTQPLIYTGQEIGLDRRLEFFEKDPITDWTANEYTDFYKYLVSLRHANPALAAGECGGKVKWIETGDPDVLAFSRKVRGNKVTVYANLQAEPSKTIKSLRSKDNPDGILPAWGWKIITR